MSTRTLNRQKSSTNGRAESKPPTAAPNGAVSRRTAGKPASRATSRPPRPVSNFTEETGEALLQPTASPRSDRLAVKYAGKEVRLELSGRGVPILQGLWDIVVSVGGRPFPLEGAWESTCWNSDEAADYLELQFRVSDTLRIDRQILLPRAGNFAVLADAVISPSANEIEVRTRFPLAAGLKFESDRVTRSARLRGSADAVRMHPLALPQDRVHSTPGVLSASGSVVELVQKQPGTGIYAPVVIDWGPKRSEAPVLWKKVTVSEYSRVLRPDEAAGYRLQIGREQWLIYHSLKNTGDPRAVLGHHTWHETVIGRFKPGSVDTLIEVETP